MSTTFLWLKLEKVLARSAALKRIDDYVETSLVTTTVSNSRAEESSVNAPQELCVLRDKSLIRRAMSFELSTVTPNSLGLANLPTEIKDYRVHTR